MKRAVPLLLVACQQPAIEAVTPDEVHVWGSQGWGDGDISTQGRDYDTSADGYRVGLGFTWSLAPPPRDYTPELERIARAVERPGLPSTPVVVVPPGASPPPPTVTPESEGEDETSVWVDRGKAAGGILTMLGIVWAAIRQSRKTTTVEDAEP